MGRLLWSPSEEMIQQSNMYEFLQRINQQHQHDFSDYDSLYAWSVDHIAEFWAAMWDYADIVHSQGYAQVIDDVTKMPGAEWFTESRLNFAENLLRYRDEQVALIFKGEDRPAEYMTYA